MTCPSGFFRGLSLALAHRVEPGAWYMPMTAYFDESGTHGAESPAILVAGFGATVAQWNGCEKRLRKLFDDYEVDKFHAKDFRGTKGDFKGWDIDKKAKFNSRFLRTIDDQLSFGVAGIVSPPEYKTHYRDKEFPRGARRDSAYGICFRAAFVRATKDFHDRPQDWPLNIVLELGHPNGQDAVRIFEEVKNLPKFKGMFGTITFAAKDDCIFLAVADSLAYALFRTQAGFIKHPTEKNAVPVGPCDPPYYVHKLRMSRTMIDKRGLKSLHRICCETHAMRRRS
jgi:hypothetical protein